MLGTPSAWLPVLVLVLVRGLDLTLGGRPARRSVEKEIEDEDEDEDEKDGFPKIRGHSRVAPDA